MTEKTFVINLIAGPGSGKSVFAAHLFIKLKLLNYTTEYVPEIAKQFTWLKDFESLNNQYLLSHKQHSLLKQMNGQ